MRYTLLNCSLLYPAIRKSRFEQKGCVMASSAHINFWNSFIPSSVGMNSYRPKNFNTIYNETFNPWNLRSLLRRNFSIEIRITYVNGIHEPCKKLHNCTRYSAAISDRSHGKHRLDLVLVLGYLYSHYKEGCGTLAMTQVKQLFLIGGLQDIIYYRRKIARADFVPAVMYKKGMISINYSLIFSIL